MNLQVVKQRASEVLQRLQRSNSVHSDMNNAIIRYEGKDDCGDPKLNPKETVSNGVLTDIADLLGAIEAEVYIQEQNLNRTVSFVRNDEASAISGH